MLTPFEGGSDAGAIVDPADLEGVALMALAVEWVRHRGSKQLGR